MLLGTLLIFWRSLFALAGCIKSKCAVNEKLSAEGSADTAAWKLEMGLG
jgi:hypothetical protein